jgi:replicative DNA helicase
MKSSSTTLKRIYAENTTASQGIKTDFPEFDKFTNGLQPGHLIVIAGRPGMGSLAFTKCLLLNISAKERNAIAIFSLEKSSQWYLEKLIALQAGTSYHELKSYHKLKKDYHSPELGERLKRARDVIAKAPIFIDDDLSFTLSSLEVKLVAFTGTFNIKLLVIDGYRLLTDNPHSVLSREQELDRIAKKLKQLAEALNIVIILNHELSHVNNYSCDENVKPSLKDLYNDAPIAKYTDLVLFLYRPEYYGFKIWYDTDDSCEAEAELIIAKNRHGDTQRFRLSFDGYRMQFNEVDDERFAKRPWTSVS